MRGWLRRDQQGPLTGPLNWEVITTLAPYLLQVIALVKSHYKQCTWWYTRISPGTYWSDPLRGYQMTGLLALPWSCGTFDEMRCF